MKKIDSTSFYIIERNFKRPLFDINKKISLNIRGKVMPNTEGNIMLQLSLLIDDSTNFSSLIYHLK
jgi:hypothetical protein